MSTSVTRKSQFYEQAGTELNQRNAQLQAVTEQLKSLKDKIVHGTLISPVNGIIKKKLNPIHGIETIFKLILSEM